MSAPHWAPMGEGAQAADACAGAADGANSPSVRCRVQLVMSSRLTTWAAPQLLGAEMDFGPPTVRANPAWSSAACTASTVGNAITKEHSRASLRGIGSP